MTAASPCIHDLLLFGSDEDLVAASRPFITDGVAAGDLVIVHGPGRNVDVLREEFDGDPRIRFAAGTGLRRCRRPSRSTSAGRRAASGSGSRTRAARAAR